MTTSTPYTPSRRALATRSLTAAMRLSGDQKRAALRQHYAEYVTSPRQWRSTCPTR